jgi:hypothetical protein
MQKNSNQTETHTERQGQRQTETERSIAAPESMCPMITSAPYLAFLHSEEDLPEEDLLLLLLVSRPRKFQEWVVCSLFTLLSNAATTSGIPAYIVFAGHASSHLLKPQVSTSSSSSSS